MHATPRSLEPTCDVIKALGAPVRLAVLLELRQGPRFVHELVEELGVSQTLVSQHLRVLRAAGLVTTQRSRYEVTYAYVPHPVASATLDAVLASLARSAA